MPTATQTAPKSFPAKYAGICARTGEQFKPGDAIVRDGRGYALTAAIVADEIETAAVLTARVARPVIGPVVGCEIVSLTAADFFRVWGTTDRDRNAAMTTYSRMTVAARAEVQAEIARRIEAGEQNGRAHMVALRAAYVTARQDMSVDHAYMGEDIIFHSEARVSMQGDRLHLHVPQNAVVTAEDSKAWAVATLAAIRAALETAGIEAHVQVRKRDDKKIVWSLTGDWYMGRFWCSGRSASLRIAG